MKPSLALAFFVLFCVLIIAVSYTDADVSVPGEPSVASAAPSGSVRSSPWMPLIALLALIGVLCWNIIGIDGTSLRGTNPHLENR